MNRKRSINIFIAAAVAAAFVVSCRGKIDTTGKIDVDSLPMQTVDGMFIVQTENGVLQTRIEAGRMEKYEKDTLTYELFPQGIKVYGYTEMGMLETEITSLEARHFKYKDGREIWQAYHNVVVKNLIKQETMETDTLYWDQKNEKIYTDCYVKLYSPDGFMQGYGMESDQRARESEIKNPFDNYMFIDQDSTAVHIDTVNFIGPMLK